MPDLCPALEFAPEEALTCIAAAAHGACASPEGQQLHPQLHPFLKETRVAVWLHNHPNGQPFRSVKSSSVSASHSHVVPSAPASIVTGHASCSTPQPRAHSAASSSSPCSSDHLVSVRGTVRKRPFTRKSPAAPQRALTGPTTGPLRRPSACAGRPRRQLPPARPVHELQVREVRRGLARPVRLSLPLQSPPSSPTPALQVPPSLPPSLRTPHSLSPRPPPLALALRPLRSFPNGICKPPTSCGTEGCKSRKLEEQRATAECADIQRIRLQEETGDPAEEVRPDTPLDWLAVCHFFSPLQEPNGQKDDH